MQRATNLIIVVRWHGKAADLSNQRHEHLRFALIFLLVFAAGQKLIACFKKSK
jgi:hypothetical protein